jgi:guanylate kinase
MIVVAICGMSGSGKSHLIQQLCARGSFTRVPSVTTRAPRPGETTGIDKYFVDDQSYDELLRGDRLVCPASTFGARYGHDRRAIESAQLTPILEISEGSIPELREAFPSLLTIRVRPVSGSIAQAAVSDRWEDGTRRSERLSEPLRGDNSIEIDEQFVNAYDDESVSRFIELVDELVIRVRMPPADAHLAAWLVVSGLVPATSPKPEAHKAPIELAPEEFFVQASQWLRESASRLCDLLQTELVSVPGRWHPSGYMIFILGLHPTLGRLRLHVWPRNLRRLEPRPGELQRDIHDHRTHVASLVLAGEYSDQFYGVESVGSWLSADELRQRRLYMVYMPEVGRAAAEAMVPNGDCVRATPTTARSVRQGSGHHIVAGDFHVPTIDESNFALTLVFTSHTVMDSGPRVLVAGAPSALTGEARVVTADEARLASSYLASRST